MYNQIYSIVNDFIKAVEQDKNFSVLLKNWNGKRGPKRKLSITQVISLNLLRFTIHIKDLKAFHRIVKSMELLPDMPNYENFLEYHQARCMDGLFRHYVSCISAYILECRLKFIQKSKLEFRAI